MLTLEAVSAAVESALAKSDSKRPSELGALVGAVVAREVVRELGHIEARLEALEARRTMSFAGPHDPGHAYAPGEVVQRGGALFVAMAHARAGDVPGASASWRRIAESKA